jgi:uncharacterized protein YqiB (DUF1249 family)
MKKTIYQTNLEKLQALCPDILELQPGDHRKSAKKEGSGLMDLNLDVLDIDTVDVAIGLKVPPIKRIVVALSHYYRHQSGDMIADPDMELAIYPAWQSVEALTFQDYRSYSTVYPEPNKVNRYLLKDLNSFLRTWLNNCKAQRHDLSAKIEEEVAA